ncbi:MAG: O-antigen ligase family protein [Planctomycetes bacterium]|nr:O-antigen ligase family protein [Planctomycetota bacterium]
MTETTQGRSFAQGYLLFGTLALAALVAFACLRSPAIALVLGLGFCVLGAALRYPDVATHAVLFLLYSNLPAVGVGFHGVPKPVAAAFPLLLALPLLRDLFLRRQPLVLTPTFFLLVLILAQQAVSAAFSIDPGKSFGSALTFAVEGVALYLLITNVLRSKATVRIATWTLVAAGILMSGVPLFQQVTGTFDDNYGGLAQVDGLGFRTGEAAEEGGTLERQARLAGPIGEKNRYAQVMLVLVPLALVLVFRAPAGPWKVVTLAAAASISLGFVLAFSRGGAIGAVCMLLVAMGLRLIDVRKTLFVAAGMGLMLMAMPQYWKRLETIGTSMAVFGDESEAAAADGATRRRVTEMLAAGRVFLDHPVIGVGPGLFKSYSEEYGNVDALRKIESGRRAHSLYLEFAAENGAIGLGLLLAALVLTIVGLAGARRLNLASDPEMADLATAYLLALVCYLSTGVFLHLSYMRYFYIVVALGGAVAHVGYATQRARAAEATRPQFAAVPVALGGQP